MDTFSETNKWSIQGGLSVLDGLLFCLAVHTAWQVHKLVKLHMEAIGPSALHALLIPPYIKSSHQLISQCLWVSMLIKGVAYFATWMVNTVRNVNRNEFPDPMTFWKIHLMASKVIYTLFLVTWVILAATAWFQVRCDESQVSRQVDQGHRRDSRPNFESTRQLSEYYHLFFCILISWMVTGTCCYVIFLHGTDRLNVTAKENKITEVVVEQVVLGVAKLLILAIYLFLVRRNKTQIPDDQEMSGIKVSTQNAFIERPRRKKREPFILQYLSFKKDNVNPKNVTSVLYSYWLKNG